MHPPLLDMTTTEVTTTSYARTTKIVRNMKMPSKTFDNDDHCISAAANFPTITPLTIIDMLKCSWLNEGLDKNMSSLKT